VGGDEPCRRPMWPAKGTAMRAPMKRLRTDG
jgi:hypothetical protein